MCPFFNSSRSECRITPSDSSAYQDGSFKDYYCTGGNHRACGNHEAYERGDYKIER
jgi:hypothetical protein